MMNRASSAPARVGAALSFGVRTAIFAGLVAALPIGEASAAPPTPVNVAQGRPPTQSTTAYGGVAGRAVDGVADGAFGAGSTTHTDYQAQPWWQVDLGYVQPIDKVVLHNRTDCCSERLSNFRILFSSDGTQWTTAATVPGVAPATLPIAVTGDARYVRVQLNGTSYLSLAEVEVLRRPKGTFFGEKVYNWGNGITNVFTGDFDGDGLWDIGVTGTQSQTDRNWYIRYGDGKGDFVRGTGYYWGNGATNVFTGDFNGDGIWDIGVTGTESQSDRAFHIRYGDGHGGFGNETYYYWGNGATNVFTGDFNGDGLWDIGVTGTQNQTDRAWHIRYGDGHGGFGNETSYYWGNGGTAIFTGDFDGDGLWDIGVTGAQGQTDRDWHIRFGDGRGNFGSEMTYGWGNGSTNVFSGDFDGDGVWDIGVTGVATEPDRHWYVRFNEGSPALPIVFANAMYGGAAQPLQPGLYDINDIKAGNDMLSSLIVPTGYRVTLFAAGGYGGSRMSFNGGSSYDLLNLFDNITSSIMVEGPDDGSLPAIYANPGFSGPGQTLAPGLYDLNTLVAVGNDNVSSLHVPSGWRVTLFSAGGFSGSSQVFTADAASLGSFDNITSSILVEAPTVATSGQPVAYSGGSYTGRSQPLDAGVYEMNNLTVGNDSIRSLTVPAGWRVTLYTAAGVSGSSTVLTADAPYLGSTFDGTTSSILVERLDDSSLAAVYAGTGYTGASEFLAPGFYDIGALRGVGNDAISSLRVPSGWTVTLYEAAGLGGRSRSFTADTTDLGDFADITSSIFVQSPQPQGLTRPVVYSGMSWTRAAQPLEAGTYDASQLAVGNDAVRSLVVPTGWRVTLYAGGGFTGGYKVFTADAATVGADFDSLTSSIMVEAPNDGTRPAIYASPGIVGAAVQTLGEGFYDIGTLVTVGNDKVSSLHVPDGWRVTLYEGGGFTGRSRVFTADAANLGDFDDITSSMLVERNPPPPQNLPVPTTCGAPAGHESLFQKSDAWGNSVFGAGYAVQAGVGSQAGTGHDTWIGAKANADVTLLGAQINVLDVGAEATADGANQGNRAWLEIAGHTILDQSIAAGLDFQKTQSFAKVSDDYFVASVSAEAVGAVGVRGSATVGATGIAVTATPYAQLSASVGASVGWGLEVSLSGNLTLLNLSLPANGRVAFVNGTRGWTFDSSAQLRSLNGKISLSVDACVDLYFWSDCWNIYGTDLIAWSGITASFPLVSGSGCL